MYETYNVDNGAKTGTLYIRIKAVANPMIPPSSMDTNAIHKVTGRYSTIWGRLFNI
ncbi:hypothetical protein D3C77_739900 [compost metagenome]